MLEIANTSKSFGGTRAIDDLTLRVEPSTIVSLIGPNGAGKTTLFNVIGGFISCDEGVISYNGTWIRGLTPWRIAKLGISRTFQDLRIFSRMSVLENVLMGIQHRRGEQLHEALFVFSRASTACLHEVRKATVWLEYVGLDACKDQRAGDLSYGQQKLLSFAICLATEAKLMLLDEPVSGVHPVIANKIGVLLRDLVTELGRTVFLIEHDTDFVFRISDKVIVIDEGRKICEGDPSSIKSRRETLEAYLS